MQRSNCHQTLRIFERSSLSAVACGRHNGSSSGSGSSSGRDAAQRHGQQTARRIATRKGPQRLRRQGGGSLNLGLAWYLHMHAMHADTMHELMQRFRRNASTYARYLHDICMVFAWHLHGVACICRRHATKKNARNAKEPPGLRWGPTV